MINEFRVEWSGKYPCLCHGEWKIYKNGELLNTTPPFENEPANTYNTYEEWHFDEHYEEIWEDYEDGLYEHEWIEKYKSWLKTLTDNEDEWRTIYWQFQEEDWRYGCCGGCI